MLGTASDVDVFAMCEIVIVLALWARNRCFDRANVFFHIPIVAQQVVQACIERHVTETTEARECSLENRLLSFVLALVVGCTPQWFAWVLVIQRHAFEPEQAVLEGGALQPPGVAWARYYLGLNRGDNDWPRKRATPKVNGLFWIWMVAARLFMFLVVAYFSIRFYFVPQGDSWFSRFFGGAICTTIGPRGHQLWPVFVYEHWFPKVLVMMSLVIVGGRFDLLTRPSYVPLFLGPSLAGSLLLALADGWEWCSESLCWIGLGLCILYLLEPLLFRWYRVLDQEVLGTEEGAQLRKSVGFSMAWKHFYSGMCPWSEENLETPKEVGNGGV